MSKFTGTWHIDEMEMWNADYFNMEVQAYITMVSDRPEVIDKNNGGEFQFGLVTGAIDGEINKTASGEILEFTWDGSDECDEASGSGWLKLKDKTTMEGKIKFHHGDSSRFSAKRA